jgi:oleandomycin transport system permease protein
MTRTAQAALTLAWRNLVQVKRSPGHLLDLVMQPVLFLVVFLFLFGGAVADDWRAYLQFLLPGILVQTVVLATTVTGANLSSDLSTGIYDRFRTLPVSPAAPLLGTVLGDAARYAVSAAAVLLFGITLGFQVRTHPLAAVGAYALTICFALAVCWVSALIGVLAKAPQRTQLLSSVVMFPLTFGSTVLVPAETLPSWMRIWVELNPVSALANSVRALLLGGPLLGPLTYTCVAALTLTAVFVPLTVVSYRFRMDR